MNKHIKRIGIFDSGIGGLTFVKTLFSLPLEEIIYLADTAYLPYGTKDPQLIQNRCFLIIQMLLKHKVDAVIIGCNSASAVAYSFLQDQFPNLFILDAIQPCIAEIHKKAFQHIGIIATPITIQNNIHKKFLLQENPQLHITEQECPELAQYIENRTVTAEEGSKLVALYLKPFLATTIDALLLGCTHYILIDKFIQSFFPYQCALIDGRNEVKSQIAPFCIGTQHNMPRLTIFATKDARILQEKMSYYQELGELVPYAQVQEMMI